MVILGSSKLIFCKNLIILVYLTDLSPQFMACMCCLHWEVAVLYSNNFLSEIRKSISIWKLHGWKFSGLVHNSTTCLQRPLSEDQKLFFKTDCCLMQVKSIAECSKGEHSAIQLTCIKQKLVIVLQNAPPFCRPALSDNLSLRPVLVF